MVQLDILYLNMYGWMLGVTHYISNILTIQTTLQHCSTGTPLWDCLSEKWDQINSSAFCGYNCADWVAQMLDQSGALSLLVGIVEILLSLVESFIELKYFHGVAHQLVASKAPY